MLVIEVVGAASDILRTPQVDGTLDGSYFPKEVGCWMLLTVRAMLLAVRALWFR